MNSSSYATAVTDVDKVQHASHNWFRDIR